MKFDNQYLTHKEYKELGGKLQEMPFNLLELRAEKEVDLQTSNRFRKLREYPQELKLCIHDLIDILEQDENPVLATDGIGNYNPQKRTSKEIKQLKIDIIKSYLNEVYIKGVRATYCGADEN